MSRARLRASILVGHRRAGVVVEALVVGAVESHGASGCRPLKTGATVHESRRPCKQAPTAPTLLFEAGPGLSCIPNCRAGAGRRRLRPLCRSTLGTPPALSAAAGAAQRQAVWPWLLLPLVALALFFALRSVKQAPITGFAVRCGRRVRSHRGPRAALSDRHVLRFRCPSALPKSGSWSLGCPKALVDLERILTKLRSEGYDVAPSYDSADVVVVNTCGFIDAAVDESLDAIGEALEQNGKVIVTGCPRRQAGAHPGASSPRAEGDWRSCL